MMITNVKCCRKAASSAVDPPTFRSPIGQTSHQGFNSLTIGPRSVITVVPFSFF